MPIYVFKCPKCEHTREVIAGMFEIQPQHCKCEDKPLMERQPTAASFSVSGYNAKNGYSKK